MLDRKLLLALVPLLASVVSVSAQGTTCNATSPCPASAPCCSEFGFCGTETFCLGGCNPLSSHALDSCMPEPVCENAVHTFPDLSRVLSNATYFGGNASAYDWVVDKGNIMNTNTSGGELALLLTQDNGGTRISSTRYIHYGKISARIKTGRWGGVVTAFITMSDIKDEIDWEFPGATTTEGQSNYFWQGLIPDPRNGNTTTGLTDTFSNYHDFAIDWKPDSLTWLVDGNVVRTLQASTTIGPDGVKRYPSTPSRIQLSIWPAGIPSSPAGTVDWAGGMINWQDPDYVAAGHFYTLIQSINITCEDPVPPSADVTSYVYNKNATAFTPTINFSNLTTINGASSLLDIGGPFGVKTSLLVAVVFGVASVLL
ncbi:glycoside hydrolase family 16 protein [Cristinia sonorae]|uniref:Glycoside hydrolase family 16 protein n=1 Tax=Cristinia sonorae TaxID=1940300 RepID=A0A8K0XKQ5_9AGAR|nr:glycoside hydrolase family 16 protein [Cristinia sonorae]